MIGNVVPARLVDGPVATLSAKRLGEVGICENVEGGLGEGIGSIGGDEQARFAVLYGVGDAAGAGPDDGRAAGIGLQEDEPESFDIRRILAGRHDEQIGGTVVEREPVVVDLAG